MLQAVSEITTTMKVKKQTAKRRIGDDEKLIELARKMSELRAQKRAAIAEEVADEAVEAIMDKMSADYDRALKLKPTTLEGFRALAKAIMWCCWGDEVRRHEHDGTDDHGVAVLMSALTGAPIDETVW